jgi:hypothetical protein
VEADVGRYFPGITEPAAVALDAGKSGSCIVDVAPLSALEDIRLASEASGFDVEGIWSAARLWAACPRAEPRLRRTSSFLLVNLGDRIEAFRFAKGSVTAIERMLPSSLGDWLSATQAELGHDAGGRAAIATLGFAGTGIPVHEAWDVVEYESSALDPPCWSPARHGKLLHPRCVSAAKARRSRKATVLAMAAAAALAVSVGVEYGEARGEIVRYRELRAGHSEAVAVARVELEALDRRVALREEIRGRASRPGRTQLMLDVAQLLPMTVHVTSLVAEGDSVLVDVRGGELGEVLAALTRPAMVLDGRLQVEPGRTADGTVGRVTLKLAEQPR